MPRPTSLPQSYPASSLNFSHLQCSASPPTAQSAAAIRTTRAPARFPQTCSRPHRSTPAPTLPSAPASKPAAPAHRALRCLWSRYPHRRWSPAATANPQTPSPPNLSPAFLAPASSTPNGTALKPAAPPRVSLPTAKQSPPRVSPRRHCLKLLSGPANSDSPPNTLHVPPRACRHPPPPPAKPPGSQPSLPRPPEPLPACTSRASGPAAPHPQTSANPPPPAPNPRPYCAPPQNPAANLFPQPPETPPPNRSKSPAGYWRSASIPLRCLQNIFSKSKIPAPHPLRQTRHALRSISPPVLFPFPGIAKPVPEKQTPLFP